MGNRCALVYVGFTLPADQIDEHVKPAIIKSLSLHHLLRSKAELDQFRHGLDCLKVIECVKLKPELMKPYFLFPNNPLTAGILCWVKLVRSANPYHRTP